MFFALFLCLAGTPDVESADTLRGAAVVAERGVVVSRRDTLEMRGAMTTAELASQSPGLILADYGGAAGLKSVNLRGLGSPHTAIMIDGIRVNDVQTGQPDLGLMGLENFGSAVVDYAQNSINFSTRKPVFRDRPVAGRVGLSAGSYGTFLPYGRLDVRLSNSLSVSVNVAGVTSRGHRDNNDVGQVRGGVDLFGLTGGGGEWSAKLSGSGAEQGTPGSVDWPSTDRQKTRNLFAQGRWRRRFGRAYQLSVSAKAARDDVSYFSEWGDSEYAQTEFQLNTAQTFNAAEWLDLSLAADLQRDGLKSSLYEAARTDVVAVAGAALKSDRFRADFTLEYEGVFDRGSAARNVVSPSLDLRAGLAEGLDLIGFARRAYRAPTFNELYYPGYGNPDLKPEDAWLTDLGMEWKRRISASWVLQMRVDGFYNRLSNKIVSVPSEADPAIWLPYNVGEVRSFGLDALARLGFAAGDWTAGLDSRYSLQSAEGVPFLSKHTVVLRGDVSFRGWSADAVWNCRCGRRDSYGEMPDWNSLDLTVGREFAPRGCGPLALSLACRNVCGRRYELVTGYPMPGRSFMFNVTFEF